MSAPKGGAVMLSVAVHVWCVAWRVPSRACMTWGWVAAVGLKPPPRERVMAAGQSAGRSGPWQGGSGWRSGGTLGVIGVVGDAETRLCQARRGVVAIAVAGLVSDLGSMMLRWELVVLTVLLG